MPHCVEPAVGLNRLFLAFLCEALVEEKVASGDARVVARLHPRIAPVKLAVLPIVRTNAALVSAAHGLAAVLRRWLSVDVDVTQSIGKRYRRQDEIGTPLCLTIDDTTLANGTVTVRDRDTMRQVRVPADAVIGAAAGRDGAPLPQFAQLLAGGEGPHSAGTPATDSSYLTFAQVARAAV